MQKFNVSEKDKNFVVKTDIDRKDIKFYEIDASPFSLHGIFKENGKYRRMPELSAKGVSEGVYSLHTATAGGRVRFKTDSPYIAIHAEMHDVSKIPHMALTGTAGFDLYVNNLFFKAFTPPYDIENMYEGVIDLMGEGEKEIIINFPLYSGVKDLYVGLAETASLKEAKPYKIEKPVVFYGSSITQGACATRPGAAYPAILSRKFDFDYINLGFSGNARAEDAITDYIDGIDMSVFVLDYDHNSPSPEDLEITQRKMYSQIRKNHPLIPIIMMSRPNYMLNDDDKKRRDVVEKSYLDARASGDKNVYFFDGAKLTELSVDSGSADSVHPNDFGFASMAKALEEAFNDMSL